MDVQGSADQTEGKEEKKSTGSGNRDGWPGKNTGMPSGHTVVGSGKLKHRWN